MSMLVSGRREGKSNPKPLPAWNGVCHRHHEARQRSCHHARSWEPHRIPKKRGARGAYCPCPKKTLAKTKKYGERDNPQQVYHCIDMLYVCKVFTLLLISEIIIVNYRKKQTRTSRFPPKQWSYHTLTNISIFIFGGEPPTCKIANHFARNPKHEKNDRRSTASVNDTEHFNFLKAVFFFWREPLEDSPQWIAL